MRKIDNTVQVYKISPIFRLGTKSRTFFKWKTSQFKFYALLELENISYGHEYPFCGRRMNKRKKELQSKAMLTLLRPKDRENKVLFIALCFTTPVIGEFGEFSVWKWLVHKVEQIARHIWIQIVVKHLYYRCTFSASRLTVLLPPFI